MVRLKKYSIHKAICDVCKGNGYVKVMHTDQTNHVHQCWECDSQGEYYVYEPTMVDSNDANNSDNNTDKFLH